MPGKVYDFKCGHCGHFEADQFVYDEKAIACPVCNSIMTRQFPSPGLVKTNFHDKPKVRGS